MEGIATVTYKYTTTPSCYEDFSCYPYCCMNGTCRNTSSCVGTICIEHDDCDSKLCFNNKCTSEATMQALVYAVGPIVILVFLVLIFLCVRCCSKDVDPDTGLPPAPQLPANPLTQVANSFMAPPVNAGMYPPAAPLGESQRYYPAPVNSYMSAMSQPPPGYVRASN